jgi:hypothetical protein
LPLPPKRQEYFRRGFEFRQPVTFEKFFLLIISKQIDRKSTA